MTCNYLADTVRESDSWPLREVVRVQEAGHHHHTTGDEPEDHDEIQSLLERSCKTV
jgi:hypothetical protein